MVKYVVKPLSQQNKKPCKPNVYKVFRVRLRTRMVGVTGFEPALPTAVAWSSRSLPLPILPALGGETSKKQPTGLFFLRFPLVPKGGKSIFLTICGDFRRFPLGERCSCALFRPLFPCVPDLFVVRYVVKMRFHFGFSKQRNSGETVKIQRIISVKDNSPNEHKIRAVENGSYYRFKLNGSSGLPYPYASCCVNLPSAGL